MAYAEREFTCRDCGVVFPRRANPSGRYRCLTCTIDHMVKCMLEMHHKSGPTWDRYRAGLRARLDIEDLRAQAIKGQAEAEPLFSRLVK